ncbi:MAG: four-helix bundle copper-binding protein [Myxococcota bacterium]
MGSTEVLLRLNEARDHDLATPAAARAIDACVEAAKAALVCADACAPLAEAFRLTACVGKTTTASERCWEAAKALLQTVHDRPSVVSRLEACRAACDEAGAVCLPHAPHHEFCRICGAACREASAACGELLAQWRARAEATPA